SVARVTPDQSTEETLATSAKQSSPQIELAQPQSVSNWNIYLTVALSGATALGAEVVWTRLLGLMLGATVYTFSIILAIFLIGLGIGSWVGAIAARGAKPAAALGWCQLFLVAAIAWTAYMIARSV